VDQHPLGGPQRDPGGLQPQPQRALEVAARHHPARETDRRPGHLAAAQRGGDLLLLDRLPAGEGVEGQSTSDPAMRLVPVDPRERDVEHDQQAAEQGPEQDREGRRGHHRSRLLHRPWPVRPLLSRRSRAEPGERAVGHDDVARPC
jgi:hypothetical protein